MHFVIFLSLFYPNQFHFSGSFFSHFSFFFVSLLLRARSFINSFILPVFCNTTLVVDIDSYFCRFHKFKNASIVEHTFSPIDYGLVGWIASLLHCSPLICSCIATYAIKAQYGTDLLIRQSHSVSHGNSKCNRLMGERKKLKTASESLTYTRTIGDGARQHFDYQIRENEIFELRHCETEMDRACRRK